MDEDIHRGEDVSTTIIQVGKPAPHVLPAAALNIENKTRSNLLPWRGQFSPQLIQALLNEYASTNAHVFDPFAGSGTVLCECGSLNLRCTGVELNPAAYHLACVYTLINVPLHERHNILLSVGKKIRTIAHIPLPLFGEDDESKEQELASKLLEAYFYEKNGYAKLLWESLIVLLDFDKNAITTSHVLRIWKRLGDLVESLPFAEKRIDIAITDARTPPVEVNSIDLVISSPPYINVFNYHQQYRKSIEALGWKPLVVAGSEFGANRKFRSNRFLTVIQYCLDITQSLRTLHHVSRDKAHLVFVLGRVSNVKKTPFRNGDIFRELATRCAGFENTLNQERVFKNKFGKLIYEDIIHLSPTSNKQSLENPRAISLDILRNARDMAPEESICDLLVAIETIDSVDPSPIFKLERARL